MVDASMNEFHRGLVRHLNFLIAAARVTLVTPLGDLAVMQHHWLSHSGMLC